jgi:hypothetical protein
MPTQRGLFTANIFDDKIYIIGGYENVVLNNKPGK